MAKVIALCGRRSGKDTIAEYLVARHGYTHISIAGPLKEAASLLFHLPLEAFETDQKDEVDPAWGCTPRQILQNFGQDMKTCFGQEFWMRSPWPPLCLCTRQSLWGAGGPATMTPPSAGDVCSPGWGRSGRFLQLVADLMGFSEESVRAFL